MFCTLCVSGIDRTRDSELGNLTFARVRMKSELNSECILTLIARLRIDMHVSLEKLYARTGVVVSDKKR